MENSRHFLRIFTYFHCHCWGTAIEKIQSLCASRAPGALAVHLRVKTGGNDGQKWMRTPGKWNEAASQDISWHGDIIDIIILHICSTWNLSGKTQTRSPCGKATLTHGDAPVGSCTSSTAFWPNDSCGYQTSMFPLSSCYQLSVFCAELRYKFPRNNNLVYPLGMKTWLDWKSSK